MVMAIPTRSSAKARPGTVIKKAVGTATLALWKRTGLQRLGGGF